MAHLPMRSKRFRSPEVGAKFILGDEGRGYGVGQIVEKRRRLLYVTIFRQLLSGRDLESAQSFEEPCLCAWTFDALFFGGEWRTIGNFPIRHIYPRPFHKVLIGGIIYISAFGSDQPGRAATAQEVELLLNEKFYSPAAVEECFFALHGLAPDRGCEEMTVAFLHRREML